MNEKLCESLREERLEIINFNKKKTNSRDHMKMQKFVIFVKKYLKINMLKIKNFGKLGTIVIIQGNIEVLQ